MTRDSYDCMMYFTVKFDLLKRDFYCKEIIHGMKQKCKRKTAFYKYLMKMEDDTLGE